MEEASMERCPTCRAAYRGDETCGRCHTELRQILAIERAAAHHRRQALADLSSGNCTTADDHARTACRLHRCGETVAEGDQFDRLAVPSQIAGQHHRCVIGPVRQQDFPRAGELMAAAARDRANLKLSTAQPDIWAVARS